MVTKQVNSGLEEIRENDMEDKEDVDQYNMDDGGTSLAQSDNTQSTGRASRRGTSLRLSFPLQSNLQDNSDFECTDSLKNTKGRKSMRRQSVSSSRNTLSASSIANGNSMFESIDLAMESLGQGRQNENISVAAAAAVVAGGAAATGKISHIQFSAHEKVLVFVNILNHTNSTDDKEDFTLSPVNKAGFPQGLGDTTTKQKGPWAYVLATIQRVHFDEDFRYYTVVRADTNSPQRADAEWMEPLKSKVGLEAAMAAAAQTGRIKTRESTEKDSHTMSSMMVWFTKVALWPDQFFKTALIPFYRRSRKATKVQVTHLLYGVSPFACKLRITGVNILVLCSFCALFLEVIGHAFLPASYDEALTIVIM